MRWRHLGWIGSLITIISSFLPWAYIDLWVITQKINGYKVDGIYTLIIGIIALILLIWKPGKTTDMSITFLGIIIILILGNNVLRFQDVLLKKKYFFGVDISNLISIGYGSYLTLLGGVVLIIYGIIALQKKRPS